MAIHPMPSPAHRQRSIVIVSVLLLHGLALWGLQSGLLQRVALPAQESVVLASVIIEAPAAAKPPPAPAQPVARAAKAASPNPVPKVAAPTAAAPAPPAAASPAPLAIADSSPASNAPQGSLQTLPAAPVAAPTAPAAQPRVELPSSDADYLHNPKSEYPRVSRQRNEQGRVVLRVFIGVDGTAQQAEIKQSSGYERLDQAALATVKSWRYVPGKRGGVPEAMWFNVPINFVLE
jgi:protein TonB